MLRPPEQVMRLERMGSFFPTRLSFMRSLLRRLSRAGAKVSRPVWEICARGYGRAVYSVGLDGHAYSLAAFSAPLDPAKRTDRVVAEAWDTTYVLCDGLPDSKEMDRLEKNATKQEMGRYSPGDLVLSRANKSVRLFEHAVESLAAGRQPDAGLLAEVGYLMRTTAVYGNGKFGIADRGRLLGRPGFSNPFQAELLAVWLIRGFTHDLVEHIARSRSPSTSVRLDREIKRHLGIGNSTGLGMAPFLVSHPELIHRWMLARETALERARETAALAPEAAAEAKRLAARARRHLDEWDVADGRQMVRIRLLREEFGEVAKLLDGDLPAIARPWERLLEATSGLSLECQELAVALVLEVSGEMVDDLADRMSSEDVPALDPSMGVARVRELIGLHYGWTLEIDFSDPEETRQFWYVSEEKLEPRLGDRSSEPGSELELPLDIARRVQALGRRLEEVGGGMSAAEFLLRFPEHRYALRRVQGAELSPYGEIRDNLIGAQCLPIDMLRCKLSFFGASKFDPKSDRWIRVNLFQGAPLFDEIGGESSDDWWLPARMAA